MTICGLNMKVEIITVNILAHTVSHATSSGASSQKYDKKELIPKALEYIENHLTKNGMEIVNVHYTGQMYVYHLIKR